MNTDEAYINQVMARLPHSLPIRSQVAMELRSHIAERVEHGHSVDDALRQLGDPIVLAESYLAAIPLVAASFGERAAAKLLDVLVFVCAYLPAAFLIWRLVAAEIVPVLLILGIALFAGGFCFYTVLAEYRFGTTIGKHLLHLRVVRESGGGISFGQSVVRQLPAFLQVGWIDVLFALFTDRSQRAFEILSKTRVVRTAVEEPS
jgi:uncharacterized RDD family membrane protein YckC